MRRARAGKTDTLKVLHGSSFTFLILILLPTIAGCLFPGSEPYDFHSGSQYELVIETSEPITNATFYLPLPVKNSLPAAGNTILTERDFLTENYSVAFA
jgi:hypothetical protein